MIEPIPDYPGFSLVNTTATVDGRLIGVLGFIHDASKSVAVFDETGGLAVGGSDYVQTPSGTFSYSGMNIMRYKEIPGEVQDGTFRMNVDFANGTGSLTGTANQITSDRVSNSQLNETPI